jgi:hypothetical protein
MLSSWHEVVSPTERGASTDSGRSPFQGTCSGESVRQDLEQPDWRPGRSDGTEDHENQKVRKHERRRGQNLRGRLVYLYLCREECEAW